MILNSCPLKIEKHVEINFIFRNTEKKRESRKSAAQWLSFRMITLIIRSLPHRLASLLRTADSRNLANVKVGFDYFDILFFSRIKFKPLLFVHFNVNSNVKADVINK